MGEATAKLVQKVAQLEEVQQQQNQRLAAQMIVIRFLLSRQLEGGDKAAAEAALLAELRDAMLRMAKAAGRSEAEIKVFAGRMLPHLEAMVKEARDAAPPAA